MILTKYFYKYSTEHHEDRVSIPEINREDYMTSQYMDMFKEELSKLKLDGDVVFLYSSGASVHQAEVRTCSRPEYSNSLKGEYKSPFVLKSMVAAMMHKYLGLFVKNGNNIVDVEILSNTCASSLYAVIAAEEHLKKVDHVIVITEEKTSFDTIRSFHEHKIKIKASDGYALAVFSNEGEGFQVTNCKRAFVYNNNPFLASAEGYSKVFTQCDMVKVHGTGTTVNSLAEEEVFKGLPLIMYKDKIGHSQGSSGLLELCMAADDTQAKGKVLCVASGLGGFYASCILDKE